MNQNPPDLRPLLEQDEISRCLLKHLRAATSTRNDLVRRFSNNEFVSEIETFLEARMAQLLLLEFRAYREAAAPFFQKHAPKTLEFLNSAQIVSSDQWPAIERKAINTILLFFRDRELPLPSTLKHIDQYLPSFDPSVCMSCAKGRYVLQDSEGFLVCNNQACRHQTFYLVESRITYGTGYSNELSWTQNKTVTLHEPLPAVSLLLSAAAAAAASTTTTSASAAVKNPQAFFEANSAFIPQGMFAAHPPQPGTQGFQNTSHERLMHFYECMDPFCGRFYRPVDRVHVEAVVDLLAKQGITLIRDLSIVCVRDALKSVTGCSAPHSNSVIYIMHVLGCPIPHLPSEMVETAAFLFQRIEQLWSFYSGGSAACFSHAFVVNQIMTLLGYTDIAAYFPFPKDGARTEIFQRILKQVTDLLQEKSTYHSNMPLLVA